MKITNLITILEAIKAKHGDVNVILTQSDGNGYYDISHVNVHDEFDTNMNVATAQINYEG